MRLTKAFMDAVSTGNLQLLRVMMKNSILHDTTFAEFHAMEKASAQVAGLYDAHDGGEMDADENSWTEAYLDRQCVRLLGNFSRERLFHVQKVARKLYPPVEKPENSLSGNREKTVSYGGLSAAVAGGVAGALVSRLAGLSLPGILAGGAAGIFAGCCLMKIAQSKKHERRVS